MTHALMWGILPTLLALEAAQRDQDERRQGRIECRWWYKHESE